MKLNDRRTRKGTPEFHSTDFAGFLEIIRSGELLSNDVSEQRLPRLAGIQRDF
jgi:hypothetical protein